MRIDLQELFIAQEKLDATIAENHHITYQSTRHRRLMACLVEIGELANATRCFKYWSNKGPESKERVLDEFADGLHFILSLGIDQGYEMDSLDVNDDNTAVLTVSREQYDETSDEYKDIIVVEQHIEYTDLPKCTMKFFLELANWEPLVFRLLCPSEH